MQMMTSPSLPTWLLRGCHRRLIYPSEWRAENTPSRNRSRITSHPPTFQRTFLYTCCGQLMSAESNELLWDDELAAQFLENKLQSRGQSPPPIPSASATGAATTTSNSANGSLESPLHCHEDPLALEDWIPNESQTDSDPEYMDPMPEQARLLMEARMAAPQGSLDGSCASHSCEHPARVEKRKRIYSYEWVRPKAPEPPVGMIHFIVKAPIFTVNDKDRSFYTNRIYSDTLVLLGEIQASAKSYRSTPI